MNNWLVIFSVYYALLNIALLLLFYFDKRQARLGRRRIPEQQLLSLGLLGGALGGLLGIRWARHKSQKPLFRRLYLLALLLHGAMWAILCYSRQA